MSKQEAQTYKTLGNNAFQQKNYKEAIEHFTKAIECDPTDHVFYSNRSGAYASLEQYEEAFDDAVKCVNLKPDWSKGYVRKGLAEFYLRKLDEAIQTYTQGLQLDPTNQQLQEGLQRAEEELSNKSSFKGGAGDQTQQLLMKLLSNPKTAAYLQDQQFVQNLMAIQKNPALIPTFANDPKMQDAFKIMFGLPDNFDYEGEAQKFKSGSKAETQQQEQPQQEQPKQEQPKQEPKKEQPKQQYQQQAQKELNEADKLKNQGNELYKKRQFEEALKFYDQAIQLKPDDVLYYNNKAACYIEMGQYENAHQACDQAIKIIQDNSIMDFTLKAKIFARKASVFAKQKEYANAIEFYEKALIESNDPKTRDELTKVKALKKEKDILDYFNPEIAEQENEEAKVFFQQGKWPEAMKKYEEAIKRNPKEGKYYGNKALCLIKLMEFPSALKLVEKQLELDPTNIKAWIKKAQCHQGLKEYHKQMDCYQAALKIDPNNQECKDGLIQVQMKMMSSNESKEDQEERARHAMADPEIQNILRDPEIMTILRNLQENPRDPNTLKALKDPGVGAKINKLIAAGVLKMG